MKTLLLLMSLAFLIVAMRHFGEYYRLRDTETGRMEIQWVIIWGFVFLLCLTASFFTP